MRGNGIYRVRDTVTSRGKAEILKQFEPSCSKSLEQGSCLLALHSKSAIYLSPVIDVLLADEALLDPGRALVADGDVAAGQEEDVPLLI